MILAVCIDERNGLSFNGRRLSSDRAIVADLMKCATNGIINISPYSLGLFKDFEERVAVSEIIPDHGYDCCFAEFCDFLSIKDEVQTLIVYKWNRHYPSDTKFPLEAYQAQMTLSSSEDFEGNSHPCITREVYVR